MPFESDHQQLAREAKAIVALAFRNGPIENLHAGRLCPICSGKEGYSHVTDDEMRAIMKSAVNKLFSLLRLKTENPDKYEAEVAFGSRYTLQWDDPDLMRK